MDTLDQYLPSSAPARFGLGIGVLLIILSLITLLCYRIKKVIVQRRIRKIRSRKIITTSSRKHSKLPLLLISCAAALCIIICFFLIIFFR